MKLEVLSMDDQDDGSAIITVDMDREMLRALARIGLLKLLEEEAKRVIDSAGES